MPRCRSAPTCSGSVHLGTVFNAFINYIFARKYGSDFLLRLDRHPAQARYEQEILDDLKSFGFTPDKVILQREREARYNEVVQQILAEHPDKVYFCDCSVQDITFRGAMGARMDFLHREEKYPSPCEITSVKIFGPEDPEVDLVSQAEVRASISNREHPVENLLDGKGSTFWAPKDVGYMGEKEPSLSFRWPHPLWVSGVEITYHSLPLRSLSVRNSPNVLARVEKPQRYYYAQHKPALLKEHISFAPSRVKQITLDNFDYFAEVKKEYYYDGFCRGRKLKLSLSDSRTTIRIKDEEAWWLPDVAIVFNGSADLCLTSIIDDMDYGIELRVRGEDIRPFELLERQAGSLLGENAVIPSYFHCMLCDESLVKYSKFIHSPRAAELLEESTVDQVLSLLAYKSGMLREFEVMPLNELVKACDMSFIRDARLPLLLSYKKIYLALRKSH